MRSSQLIALAVGALLAATIAMDLARAQEPPPDQTLCAPADPARAIHMAIGDERLIVAVAEPTAPSDQVNGTPVRIIQVVEGSFALTSAIADKQPSVACRSSGVWVIGRRMIGVFLVEGNRLYTLAAWPVVGGQAQTRSALVPIDGLMAKGRAFVEPAPTALPPGVPPPPTVIPPSAGESVALPSAGSDESPSQRSTLGLLVVIGVILVAGTTLVALARRR